MRRRADEGASPTSRSSWAEVAGTTPVTATPKVSGTSHDEAVRSRPTESDWHGRTSQVAGHRGFARVVFSRRPTPVNPRRPSRRPQTHGERKPRPTSTSGPSFSSARRSMRSGALATAPSVQSGRAISSDDLKQMAEGRREPDAPASPPSRNTITCRRRSSPRSRGLRLPRRW